MMDPNVKVMIAALRAGKGGDQALTEYCWAKLALPVNIGRHTYQHGRDPLDAPIDRSLMAISRAIDAFEEGRSDEEIEAEFFAGMKWDREEGDIAWRPMKREERPTAGQLVRAMSAAEHDKAMEIFGTGPVVRMFTGK